MRLLWSLAALLLLPARILAQEALTYRVEYSLSKPSEIHVTLRVADGVAAPLTLLMPRTVPGGYAQRPYDPTKKRMSSAKISDHAGKLEKVAAA